MQRVASNSRRKRDVEDVGHRCVDFPFVTYSMLSDADFSFVLIREEEVKRWTDSDEERDDREMEIQREGQRELHPPDVDIGLTASDPSLAISEPDPYAMES
jgi:hypothetical protein